jgi:hypothetical protein
MMLAAQPYTLSRRLNTPPALPTRRVDRRLQFIQTLGQVKPCAGAWAKVFEGFEAWSARDAGFGFWVSLAADQLTQWQDSERVLPQRWLWALLGGEECPAWVLKLSKGVKIEGLRRAPALGGLWAEALMRSGVDKGEQVRWLGLHDAAALQADALGTLLTPGTWAGINHVSLQGAVLSAASRAIVGAWLAQHRRRVELTAQGVGLTDEGLGAWLEGGALADVARLSLQNNALTDRGVGLLVAQMGVGLPRLRSLDLSGNPIGNGGLMALQRAQRERPGLEVRLGVGCMDGRGVKRWLALGWREGEVLDVSKQQLSEEVSAGLIGRMAGRGVKQLDLSATGVRGLGLRAWLRAPWVAGEVERLALRANGLGAGSAWPSAELAGLRALDVSCNPLRAGGVRALAGWQMPGLQALRAERAQLGDEGLQALLEAGWWGGLQEVELSMNGVSARGVGALSARGLGAKLTRLNLSGNPLGDEGVEALAAACAGSSVRWLDVSGCGASARAALSPLMVPNKLTYLAIGEPITEEEVRWLATSPHLTQLQRLDAAWGGLTEAALAPLRDSPWVSDALRAFLATARADA